MHAMLPRRAGSCRAPVVNCLQARAWHLARSAKTVPCECRLPSMAGFHNHMRGQSRAPGATRPPRLLRSCLRAPRAPRAAPPPGWIPARRRRQPVQQRKQQLPAPLAAAPPAPPAAGRRRCCPPPRCRCRRCLQVGGPRLPRLQRRRPSLRAAAVGPPAAQVALGRHDQHTEGMRKGREGKGRRRGEDGCARQAPTQQAPRCLPHTRAKTRCLPAALAHVGQAARAGCRVDRREQAGGGHPPTSTSMQIQATVAPSKYR